MIEHQLNTNRTLQNELMRREAVGLLIIASADLKTCEKQLVFNTLQLLATKRKIWTRSASFCAYLKFRGRLIHAAIFMLQCTWLGRSFKLTWRTRNRTRLRQTRTSRSRVFCQKNSQLITLCLPIDLYCLSNRAYPRPWYHLLVFIGSDGDFKDEKKVTVC